MQEVHIARDFWDYLEAIGSFASVLIALVAAWFAWRSAKSSEESAEAAERTAEAAEVTADAAKKETELLVAERERTPKLQANLEIEELTATPEGVFHAFVKFEALNSGERTAEDATYAIFAPASVAMKDCRPDRSLRPKQVRAVPQSQEVLEVDGEPQPSHALIKKTNLAPHVAQVRRLRLTFDKPGRYQILGGVRHPDSPTGEGRAIEEIRVPRMEAGQSTSSEVEARS